MNIPRFLAGVAALACALTPVASFADGGNAAIIFDGVRAGPLFGVTNPGYVANSVNVVATDCSATATGSAQILIAALTTIHGFSIANIDPSAGGGEPVWISFTGTAVAGALGSYALSAPAAVTYAGMGSYTTPPGFGSNHAVSALATTVGHKISCSYW